MHERVAVIDLGPVDDGVRKQLGAQIVGAGLELVIGDGVEDALAGQAGDRDALPLLEALGEAQRAFGALDCAAATRAAQQVAGIGAARQAAGLPVPELARAWTYLLLCADRANDPSAALIAAGRLRTLGGSPDVPADVWAKYPEVDAVAGGERVPLEITADATGATIWVDYRPVGTSPVTVTLEAGDHVIAAAAGTRRGWAAGTAVRAQAKLQVPTTDVASSWSEVATKVASWQGNVPPPVELGFVLARVHARVALVRRGNHLEVWGRIGLAEPPHKLGGDDAVGSLAEADRLLALVIDRVRTWNDHAPDPDQPLLREDPGARRKDGMHDPPTKWWVYAAIGGAVLGGIALIYANDAGTNRQRVELHVP